MNKVFDMLIGGLAALAAICAFLIYLVIYRKHDKD
jgi:hypothetical protein